MLKLDKKLAAIESQRKHYLIELNRSKYAKEIESAIWNRAADLSSRLDLRPEVKETDYIAKNNKEGARQAFDMVRNSTSKTLSLDDIKAWHTACLAMVNPNVIGHWRQVRAHWLNSTMIMSNWSSIPYLMDNLVQGINTHQVPAYYWTELPNRQFQRFARHPVMEAIEANYNTISIHPFEDGNKRTARLVTAWILKRAGHIPLTVYNREEYINEIETYYNTRQPHGFYEFLLDQMHQTYDEAGQEIARMNTTISNAPSLPCAACRHIHGVRRDKQK